MSNLKIYCAKCGAAHGYTLEKPNFCQSCGSALGAVNPKSQGKLKGLEIEKDEDSFNNNLTALEFEHEVGNLPPQTLGSIMQQSASQPINNERLKSDEKSPADKQEVLEQLKKESSTLRPRK